MNTGLKDRVAIVAAASHGLGRAAATGLATEGVHVAICSRDNTAINAAAEQLRTAKVQVHAEAFDVGDTAALEQFVANVHRIFGRIDICVTNAGGPPAKQFLETTDEEWNAAFNLNLRSAVAFARAVIPHMQRQKWGRFITLSSITVRESQPELVLSNSIRPGIMGLVRTLATDFGKDGILVNNVAPGYIATNRVKQLVAGREGPGGEGMEEGWTAQIPLGRLGKPEEVADAIVWLASERASFVTGQTVLVDGGMYKGL